MRIARPHAGIALACVGAVLLGHACVPDSALQPPKLTSVEPAAAEQGQSLPLRITGEGFFVGAHRRLGEGLTVEEDFRARLGDAALGWVTRSSDSELSAQSPATLVPGVYTLTVDAPGGSATLEGAFTVWPPGACDGGCPDASFDAGNAGDAGAFPYVPSNFDPTALPKPTTSANFSGCTTGFDTGTDTWYQPCATASFDITHVTLPGGQEATVLSTLDLTIASDSRWALYGARPAIIAVFGNVTIDGELWANSTSITLRKGPGANPASCGAQTGSAASATHGGGGGGAFGSRGWPGGAGGGGAAGADGGIAATAFPLEPLRGGCAGGSNSGGLPGGSGGGALQISAAGELRVRNEISVSGAAGYGGLLNGAGGSGAGSGGMLLLEGNTVVLEAGAVFTSNGGGGGGGAGGGAAQSGSPGTEGWTDAGTPVPGGNPGAGGGRGGSGAALLDAGSAGSAAANEGGGGGGGGVGVIFVRSAPGGCTIDPAALFSPPAQKVNCP